ncbi:AAA family ATPase [Tropicimonas sediminicola]|uniref:AAA family ATPase n=1 Tax=Tropicimonas sediminicola TaxID=1031541 RepID=UPI001595F54E|nr:AAA family ATPase [Tropicimonas sediminicola]
MDAIHSKGGTAFIVGPGEGEKATGEAAGYRTPEGGDGTSDVVLVATDGQADELKTNEGFRDQLAFGLPGGLEGRPNSIVRSSELALNVARLVLGVEERAEDARNQLADALEYIFSFLADAYENIGNDEQSWSSAYWQHLESACENLPKVMKFAEARDVPLGVNVVFASAGLPVPSSGSAYDPTNDATKFSKRLLEGWASLEAIEKSIVSIDAIDGTGEGDHPIMQLDWDGYTASRTNLGHPILAALFHGGENDAWIDSWLSCSEKGFFTRPNDEQPSHELFAINGTGSEARLVDLGLQGLDYVLPPAPAGPLDSGRFSIGNFKLRLGVQFEHAPGSLPLYIEATPASAALVEIMGWSIEEGSLVVSFRMSRKLGTRGKWRETPVTLSVEPKTITAESSFRAGLKLKLLVPHPSRPTVIAAERSEGTSTRRISHPATSEFLVEGGNVVFGGDGQESSVPLKLRNSGQVTQLYVVGLEDAPTWSGGGGPREIDSEYLPEFVRVFEVPDLPEDATLALGRYTVEVSAPEIEKGHVNPVFVALTGQPQVTPSAGMLEALRGDPRGPLEDWLSQNCLSADVPCKVRETLGSCILALPGAQSDVLEWHEGIGAFTDISAPIAFHYPRLAALDEFWLKFEALELHSLPGATREPAWPSTLDFRELDAGKLEAYLGAFIDMMDTAGPGPANACAHYPLSAILYNTAQGEVQGVLLSPLHPVRLAWAWSVQNACTELFESGVYRRAATSFLRFVDGENIPLMGPSLQDVDDAWFSVGLSAGPSELFSGWSLVASQAMITDLRGRSVSIIGRQLPFGTPSGLDKGGVTVALKDYLRVYPTSPKLRIGLASPTRSERYPETDDAIIAAATSMLAEDRDMLPGGIRVLDSLNREGNPPSPSRVLSEVSEASQDRSRGTRAPFEWTMEREDSDQGRVDIQFIENSIVRLGCVPAAQDESAGTTGPRLPVNRFRVWQRDDLDNKRSSVCVGVQPAAFSGLGKFSGALSTFENRAREGKLGRLVAALSLGHSLMSDRARWTVTGNRHLDPSVLSAQLRQSTQNIALWEWRPAFLKRRQGQSLGGTISSSHPYTVLAKPPRALVEGITSVFKGCGIPAGEEEGWNLIAQLGMRGVGLSSLLTMGHAQSVGAVGFSLAFNALSAWEDDVSENEVRCILPMDAVYPLVDALAEGAKATDDQKRADLLLLSVKEDTDGAASVTFHPVEVKMRTAMAAKFPEFGSKALEEPLEQLASTGAVLRRAVENFVDVGSSLVLVNSALATLFEAGLAMRPIETSRDTEKEARLLTAIAEGHVTVACHPGTLLWFQSGAFGPGGRVFSLLPGRLNSNEVNQLLANPAAVASADSGGEVQVAIKTMLSGGDLSEIYAGAPKTVATVDVRPGSRNDKIDRHGPETGEMGTEQKAGSRQPELQPDREAEGISNGNDGQAAPNVPAGDGGAHQRVAVKLTPEELALKSRVDGAFEGFVGNEQAVRTLKRDVLYAFLGGSSRDDGQVSLAISYLLTGPPSTGKTELSRRIATALGLPFVMLDGKAVDSRDSLFQFIRRKLEEAGSAIRELGIDAGQPVRVYPPFIVLIDEVHLVRPAVQEALLTLLEPNDRQVTLKDEVAKVPRATFLLATTRASEVDNAFKTRCTEIQLRPYSSGEVAEMLRRAASSRPELESTVIPIDFLRRLAGVARNVPRVAIQLLDELQREIVVARISDPEATLEVHLEAVRDARGIDESGLGPDDLEVLRLLQRQERPLSESQLLGQLSSVDRDRLKEEVFPYLSKLDLIRQTGQGRVITDKGRAYLLERSLG